MTAHAFAADHLKLNRVYEPAAPDDGTRILVDRLWPRGLTKAEAAVDCWVKEIAPSIELRQWLGHDLARWPEFRRRNMREPKQHKATLDGIRELARRSAPQP